MTFQQEIVIFVTSMDCCSSAYTLPHQACADKDIVTADTFSVASWHFGNEGAIK